MTSALYSRRQVALYGGLALAVLLPAFTALGLWQWNKEQDKLARQAELVARSSTAALVMPPQPAAAAALRHHRFVLRGEYEARHQILVDNRVHAGRAGYHVVTPLRLAGSDMRVLVNRGWVPAAAEHRDHPRLLVPGGPVEISGIAIVPPERFFTLAATPVAAASGWSPVWQNLDLARFRRSVAYPLQPVVIQLDATAPGGYGRAWPRPDAGAERHLGYAVQWFGFAATSLGLWLYFLRRAASSPPPGGASAGRMPDNAKESP